MNVLGAASYKKTTNPNAALTINTHDARKAWEHYNCIPEVKRIITDHANLLSSFEYKLVDMNGNIINDETAKQFLIELNLQNAARMFSTCVTIAGQGIFVTPTWSQSLEIQCYANHVVAEQTYGKETVYRVGTNQPQDDVPSDLCEQWATTSPDLSTVGWVQSAYRLCEKIIQLERAVISQALSNIPGSIFFVPVEATPKTLGIEGDKAMGANSRDVHDLQNIFARFIDNAMEDYRGGGQVEAGIITLHSQFIQYINQGKVDLSRPIDQNIHIELEQAIKQLAKSGPLPPEDLLGFGVTNRWNSKEIAKQRLQTYLVPEATLFCSQISPLIERIALAEGMSNIVGVVADPTPLYAKPDLTDIAGEALQLGVISKKNYAILAGIPLEYIEDNGDNTGTGTNANDGVDVLNASNTEPDFNGQYDALENAFNSVLTSTLDDLFIVYAKRVDARSKNLARKDELVKEKAQGKGALYELIESADVYYEQVANENVLSDEEKQLIIETILVYMARSEHIGDFTARELKVLQKEIESGKLGSMRSKDKPSVAVKRLVEKIGVVVSTGFVELMRERIVGYLNRRKNNPNAVGYRVDGEKSLERFFTQHDVFQVANDTTGGTSFLVNQQMENINGFRSVGRKKWFYGDIMARQEPYDPHVVLDGQITEGTDIAGFYPGDHKNCKCSFVDIIERV